MEAVLERNAWMIRFNLHGPVTGSHLWLLCGSGSLVMDLWQLLPDSGSLGMSRGLFS
jgi:hypothetical protein